MAFTSLHSAFCKHSPSSQLFPAAKSFTSVSTIAGVSFSRVWAISSEGCCSCRSQSAAMGFPTHGASSPDCLPWLWCCGMTWHMKETVSPKQTQPQSSSVTAAQGSGLNGKLSPHSSMLPNLWKSSRMAVNTFTLQNSTWNKKLT